MAKVLRYFLGVHSPQGYVSRPDQLGEPGSWRCWVVLGGAAATRSRLIADVRRAMEDRCPVIEELLCPMDPLSLDGAIFPGLRRSIADGEPPHALPPRFPGVYEQPVPLWDCLDRGALWDAREELLSRARETDRLQKDAGGYLYAAGALMEDLVSAGASAMDRGKLLAYARRLAAREFPRPSGGAPRRGHPGGPGARGGQGHPGDLGGPEYPGGPNREKVRFLSAVTGGGRVLLRDTIAAAAPRVIAIEDSWGAVGGALLEALRDLALASGTQVVSCRCPLFPFTKLDHLLLPQMGLAFVTLGPGAAPALAGMQERTIHAGRFSDPALLRQRRARGRFLRKAVAGMLDQTALALAQAAQAQRRVDELLLSATDSDKVERLTERVIEEISQGG